MLGAKVGVDPGGARRGHAAPVAHERAARIALGELEQFASRQKNTLVQRRSEITGNICAAAFTHDASRALDPQLHTHFVIANATRDRNGKWYALSEYEMIGAVRYAGKVYQNEMARAVRELGYGVRQTRQNSEVTGFEIEGVSGALRAFFQAAGRKSNVKSKSSRRGRRESPR